jgi:hypothetical protein
MAAQVTSVIFRSLHDAYWKGRPLTNRLDHELRLPARWFPHTAVEKQGRADVSDDPGFFMDLRWGSKDMQQGHRLACAGEGYWASSVPIGILETVAP